MGRLILALVVIALLVMAAGTGRSGAIRRASRTIAFLGFAFFGLVSAASLYGMFALADRGGGVLLFLALPTAFIAWLFFAALTTSRQVEALEALPPDLRRDRTNALLESQIAEHERTIADAEAKVGGFWITPGKRKRLREEIAHSRLMLAGLRKMRSAADDAAAQGEPGGASVIPSGRNSGRANPPASS